MENAKPYERFLHFGAESLTDAELLAIIIRTGTRNKTAVEVARDLLDTDACKKYGLNGLYYLSLEDICHIRGIGMVKAIKIKAMGEIAIRMQQQLQKEKLAFDKPDSVAKFYMQKLRHLTRERVMLLLLDVKCKLIKEVVLSQGTADMSLLDPREIFWTAAKENASKILLLHNHPSGDPTPSGEDIKITQRIYELGNMMNIELVDHLVIGDNKYVSIREMSLLQKKEKYDKQRIWN